VKWLVTLLIALLACAGLWRGTRAASPARARFVISIVAGNSGTARVDLHLSDLAEGPIELAGALGEELMHVTDFAAVTDGGRALAHTALPGRLPRFRLEVPRGATSLRASWLVRPSSYLPPHGEHEFRRCGVITAEGCALALLSFALVPSCPLPSVELEARLPEGWVQVASLPRELALTHRDSWWEAAIVAGRYREPRNADGVSLSIPTNTTPETARAVERLVGELGRRFGPPRHPLHVLLAPAGEVPEPVELPGLARTAVVDVRTVDVGSLARALRVLVPAWFGRLPAELEADQAEGSWFALGLREYLALSLPGELGLTRPQTTRLERQWLGRIPGLDLRTGVGGPSERRAGAAARIHELARTWSGPGPFAEALREYSGSGLPIASDPAASAAWSTGLAALDRAPLSFEEEWRFELAPTPRRANAGRVARVVDLAFTAETEGYLESCGCKQFQAGGVAQRAQGLADLRAERPGLFLFDLGNFAPIEEGRARLEPLVEEELRVCVEALGLTAYDGVALGMGDLFCGSDWLRREAPRVLPILASGLRGAGLENLPSSRIVERQGLRVGYIGFLGLDEGALTREVHEQHLVGLTLPGTLAGLYAEARRIRREVDLLIVGGRLTPRQLVELSKSDVGVDLVLLSGLRLEESAPRAGFLGDLAIARDGAGFNGFNVARLALDEAGRPVAMTNEASVRARIERFNASLAERADLVAGMKPLFEWDPWQRDDYVGAESCATCHAREYEQWRETPHAKAMPTLAAIRRDRHPKCVQCHVVGFGSSTGYRMGAPDPRVAGVQCEVCHGAGGAHARDPARGAMRRTPSARVCTECHDAEHSEGFEARFGQAWAAVVHSDSGQ
jgi:hypothetical protein